MIKTCPHSTFSLVYDQATGLSISSNHDPAQESGDPIDNGSDPSELASSHHNGGFCFLFVPVGIARSLSNLRVRSTLPSPRVREAGNYIQITKCEIHRTIPIFAASCVDRHLLSGASHQEGNRYAII